MTLRIACPKTGPARISMKMMKSGGLPGDERHPLTDPPDEAEVPRALGAGCNGEDHAVDSNGIGQAQIQSVFT